LNLVSRVVQSLPPQLCHGTAGCRKGQVPSQGKFGLFPGSAFPTTWSGRLLAEMAAGGDAIVAWADLMAANPGRSRSSDLKCDRVITRFLRRQLDLQPSSACVHFRLPLNPHSCLSRWSPCQGRH
jgi:hypothetical protein